MIRKAILAGTSPEVAEGLAEIPQTLQAATKKSEETKRNLKDVLFFTDTEEGKATQDNVPHSTGDAHRYSSLVIECIGDMQQIENWPQAKCRLLTRV